MGAEWETIEVATSVKLPSCPACGEDTLHVEAIRNEHAARCSSCGTSFWISIELMPVTDEET